MELVESVESPTASRGRARLGLLLEASRAPTEVHYCPVGCCVPDTARAVQVEGRGQLCARHRTLVSLPQLRKLDAARTRRSNDLDQLLAHVVDVARVRDRHWAPWLIVWTFIKGPHWHPSDRGEVRGVEMHHDGRRALQRALALDFYDSVELVCCTTGERMTPTQALVSTAHQIEDCRGTVIGKGHRLSIALVMTRWPEPIPSERPPGVSHLEHARAYLASTRVGCQARSLVTNRVYSIADAWNLLERAKQ
jgi:hypothetical protein